MVPRLAHWPAIFVCCVTLCQLLTHSLRLTDGSLHARLGQLSAIFLLACLACRPLAKLTGKQVWLSNRRPLGLWCWFLLCAHVVCYLAQTIPDHGWLNEFLNNPNLWFGGGATVILASLALTSSRRSQVYLKKRWKPLHRLVYLAGALVGFHLALSGNAGLSKTAAYSLAYLLVMWPRKGEITGLLPKHQDC